MKNKKILIVSHQFLPLSSPRTTRWKQIVDELVERGNEVTILSGTAPDNSLENYRVLFFGNKIITTTISNARNASNQKSNNYFKNLILNIAKVIYRLVFKLFLGLIMPCFGFSLFLKIEKILTIITMSFFQLVFHLLHIFVHIF